MSRLTVKTRPLLVLIVAAIAAMSLTSPARAVVPFKSGFAYWDGAVVGQQAPVTTTITPLSVGRYRVIFPGQGFPGGSAHVTAINSVPHWCQVENLVPVGADEYVVVRCYKYLGVLQDTPFAVTFSVSTSGFVPPGSYAALAVTPAGVATYSINSAAMPNTIVHSGAGLYTVSLSGVGLGGGAISGSIQVTAVNSVPARCKISSWVYASPLGQKFIVRCYNAGSVLQDTGWTLSYHEHRSLVGSALPPTYFGYLLRNQTGTVPALNNWNQPVIAFGVNTVVPGYTVTFPATWAVPGNVQTVAVGANPNFCSLGAPWAPAGADVVVSVKCWTPSGAAATNQGFITSFGSTV